MLWRVARGMDHFHFYIAYHPAVAIAHQEDIRVVGVGVFPVGVTHVAQIEGRAGGRAQFTAAADKVGMDVGLCHMGDAQPFPLCGAEVRCDIAHGVHHQCFPRCRTAHQVGGLGQFLIVKVFQ